MEARTARQLLEAERERLLRIRRGLEEERGDGSVESGPTVEMSPLDQHQADVGSEVFELEKDRSILGSVDADLRDVDDALARLGRGDYGLCETCGAVIPDERLEAVPATRFCVDHEVLWEGTRMTWAMPAGAGGDQGAFADDVAGTEAARHLEFLPGDDEPDEALELGPEERALHESDGGGTDTGGLPGEEVELVEAREGAEEYEAGRGDPWVRAEAEALASEEEQLARTRRRGTGRR